MRTALIAIAIVGLVVGGFGVALLLFAPCWVDCCWLHPCK